jgi:hypothetical protein
VRKDSPDQLRVVVGPVLAHILFDKDL